MKLAKIYLLIVGVGVFVFGVLYLFTPDVFTDGTGFGTLKPEAVTDVRATYGGFQLGVGLYLIWAARDRTRYRSAILLVGLLFSFIAGSRAYGLIVDGEPTAPMLGGLSLEVVLASLSWGILNARPARDADA